MLLFVASGLFLILWLACILGCGPAISKPAVYTITGPTMGTRYTVRIVASEQPDAELKSLIEGKLNEINGQMSTYEPDSELSRFNASLDTDWFGVSNNTAQVVRFALKVAEDTEGAFDLTVGPVVNLWGFGPEGRRVEPPEDDVVAETLAIVGYSNLEVRIEPPSLRKRIPDLQVDLSAVAKGYAVDAIGDLLVTRDVSSYMIEIGGEVLTRGEKPGGIPWRIGLEKPEPGGRVIRKVVKLPADSLLTAIATSGDYRNFFAASGVRYSHTISPKTGRPVMHDLATVTVRAKTCMEADALATALLVLGPKEGYDWAERYEVSAQFVFAH